MSLVEDAEKGVQPIITEYTEKWLKVHENYQKLAILSAEQNLYKYKNETEQKVSGSAVLPLKYAKWLKFQQITSHHF